MSAFEFSGDGPDGKPKWLLFPCQHAAADADDRCRVAINGQRNAAGATWSVTGDETAPTVTPSVHCRAGSDTLCHFWIRQGRFNAC